MSANATASKKKTGKSLPPINERLTKDTRNERTNELPDYGVLAIPRTNNYYAAVGGCPCIPRCGGRPGGYSMRSQQTRSVRNEYSATNNCDRHNHTCSCGGSGKAKQAAASGSGDKVVDKRTTQLKNMNQYLYGQYEYGWRPGPHTVNPANTAATGKCDTYGNMAFKSTNRAHGIGAMDDCSDCSSAGATKLADLEELILEEHAGRMRVEADLTQLRTIADDGTADAVLQEAAEAEKNATRTNGTRAMAQASQDDINELLREIKTIRGKPLNQTNMDMLRRILEKQEAIRRKKDYDANLAYDNMEKNSTAA